MSDSRKPLVSVIIPTHERMDELRRAVQSVLHQTWREFELIVVDDASSIPASQALKDITDARLIILRQDCPRGAPATRNRGFRHSKGAFIAFLDDDDEFLPGFLEETIRKMFALPSSVGVIHTGIRFLFPDGRVMRESRPHLSGDIRENLLRGEKDSNVMGLIRRECLEKVQGFDEALAACQDWDLWLRVAEFYRFDYVTDILAVYHCHPGQLSLKLSTLIQGRTRMVEKHRAVFAKDPKVLCIHLKRLGKFHALNGTWSKSWRYFEEALRLRPVEAIKIMGWLVFEYPWVKWFSPRYFMIFTS